LWGGPGAGEGGTITAVGPTTITVSRELAGSLSVTTNASTSYSEAGKKVARSALSVGERVIFIPATPAKPASTGTGTPGAISGVVIVLPRVSGKIVSVSGSKVVVAGQDGLNVTVNTSPATTYEEEGQSAPASDLKPGTYVSATGTLSADHDQIDAITIEIVLPSLTGRVTAVAGTTISITLYDGTTESVTTGSSTAFRDQAGKTTIASVAKGDFVVVSGEPGSANTFSAVTVDIGPGTSAAPALPGSPGPGGMGPGAFGGFAGQGRLGGHGGFARGWSGGPGGAPPSGTSSVPGGGSTQL
jgi:hypothetical protein